MERCVPSNLFPKLTVRRAVNMKNTVKAELSKICCRDGCKMFVNLQNCLRELPKVALRSPLEVSNECFSNVFHNRQYGGWKIFPSPDLTHSSSSSSLVHMQHTRPPLQATTATGCPTLRPPYGVVQMQHTRPPLQATTATGCPTPRPPYGLSKMQYSRPPLCATTVTGFPTLRPSHG